MNKIVRGDGVDGVGRGKSRRSILIGFENGQSKTIKCSEDFQAV